MTTTQWVVLGVVVLTVLAIMVVLSVCHARTVLDEAEMRTGVRRCSLCGGRAEREARRREHLAALRDQDDDEAGDERTA